MNSLSVEVQKALAEEQAAREAAAKKAAEEAAAKAQANGGEYYKSEGNANAQSNSNSGKSNNSGSNTNKGNANSGSNTNKGNGGSNSNAGGGSNTNKGNANSGSNTNKGNSGSASNTGSSSNKGNSGISGAWRNTVIAAATRMVGGTYVWGACNPGSRTFDCSGLTSYAYSVAGISIGHSSASQSSFCTKPISQAEPGDVVWRPGHVGIYIGGGATIEAFSPSQGIGYGSVSSFSRCGSPV